MDGKRGWGWAILLAPIAAWKWLTGLFGPKKPPPPPTFSRWSDTQINEFMDTTNEQTKTK